MATFPKPYIRTYEKLFIKRFRLKINQTKMAEFFGTTRYFLSKMELGELDILPRINISDIKLK